MKSYKVAIITTFEATSREALEDLLTTLFKDISTIDDITRYASGSGTGPDYYAAIPMEQGQDSLTHWIIEDVEGKV